MRYTPGVKSVNSKRLRIDVEVKTPRLPGGHGDLVSRRMGQLTLMPKDIFAEVGDGFLIAGDGMNRVNAGEQMREPRSIRESRPDRARRFLYLFVLPAPEIPNRKTQGNECETE